jgi:thiamine pyrophosphate-dependent acetolactate synthase large subunit-like protein
VNTASLVGATLAELGVAQAFGVVGSGNFTVTNALRAGGVPYVAARHECGATVMADAYARMSDRLAAVSLHQGCGLTNALTGITEAAKSRTPLLVLAADTSGAAVTANFRIDQDAAVTAVGAVAERVHSPESAVADTVRAYRKAVHERRTVVLNLPLDVQAAPAVPVSTPTVPVPAPVRPNSEAVAAIIEAVRAARRPVFVAGRGARHAGAELRALADAVGALLATSAVAHGLFADDPWSLGISGGFTSPTVAELIASTDLVIGWGCALNKWTTKRGELLGGTVVQVDVDPAAFGAHNRCDLGVVGDVAQTAADVLAALDGFTQVGYRTAPVGSTRMPVTDESTSDRIDPRVLSARLDELLPADRVVSVDSGNFMGYPSAYLSVPDQYGFCFTQAFQSIGLGLATAIGAALAQPDRLSVAALGDGGFLMGVAELETVVRLGIPMVIVVYNDAAYGAEIHHFGADADLSTVTFPDTDLAAMGAGFGCAGLTVRTVADLRGVTDWLSGPRDRPLLIDAKLTNDGGSWWLAEAFR